MSKHLERGRLLVEKNRSKEALDELAQHINEFPEDFEGYVQASLAYTNLGENKKSLESILVALSKEPENPFVHHMVSLCYMKVKKTKKAKQHAMTALEGAPDDADLRYHLGYIHLQSGSIPKSLEQFELGLKIDPTNTNCLNMKAIIQRTTDNNEEAEKALGDAITQNPDDAMTQANLGWQQLAAKNQIQAREHFQESLRIQPNYEWAHEGLVQSFKESNPFFEALSDFSEWIKYRSVLVIAITMFAMLFVYIQIYKQLIDNPWLKPILIPLALVFIIFAMAGLTVNPLYNLALSLSSDRNYLLSTKEQKQAYLWGGLFLTATIFLAICFYVEGEWIWKTTFICFAALPPLDAYFRCKALWAKRVMGFYLFSCVALGLFVVVACDILGLVANQEICESLDSITFWGFIISFWFGNHLANIEPVK